MKKKININVLAIMLILFFSILIIARIFYTTNPQFSAKYSFEGEGTKEKPYEIKSVEDFMSFKELVNGGTTFAGQYFVQKVDLDLSGIENWVPIGEYNSSKYFYGVYDGGGHVLYNLRIVSTKNSGLFGMLCGEVRNLGIESGYIEGVCVGGITSHGSASSRIFNCYNKATIYGLGRAGGIADNSSGEISYCWNFGELSCAEGGLIGGISSYNSATINECYSLKYEIMPEFEYQNINNSHVVQNIDIINIEEYYQSLYTYCEENLIEWNDLRINFMEIEEGDVVFSNKIPVTFKYRKIEVLIADYGITILLIMIVMIYLIWYLSRGKKIVLAEKEVEGEESTGNIENRKINWMAVILVVFLVSVGYIGMNEVLMLKRSDGVTAMQYYYQQPEDTIDVLILGSSKAGVNLDTEVLWSNYGISSYSLWGSVQPFWNSYYFLKEALEISKPKVVVLEVNAATYNWEYSDFARQYTNIFGMKMSLNKIEAIQASVQQKHWFDMLWGFPIYHTRYNELTKYDFEKLLGIASLEESKGSSVRYGICNEMIDGYTTEQLSQILEVSKINIKQEEYLRKIINVCKVEKIPLLLISTPSTNRASIQSYLNYVQQIASEYNVPYINFNLMDNETGFDNTLDFYTDKVHLNTNGGRKISFYLGSYLVNNYGLADHRGDEKYKSWDVHAYEMQNRYYTIITKLDDYLAEIKRNERLVLFVKNDIRVNEEKWTELMNLLVKNDMNISCMQNTLNECWMMENSKVDRFKKVEETNNEYEVLLGENKAIIIDDGKVYYQDEKVCELKSGITCIVYDKNTQEIVDICHLYDGIRTLDIISETVVNHY